MDAQRDWLDDEHTRKKLHEIKVEIERAAKDILVSAGVGELSDIRNRAGYYRGLQRAWAILNGGKAKDEE